MEKSNLSEAKLALLENWLQGKFSHDEHSISRRPSNSPVRLSFPQQRQLFLELLERDTVVNNLSVFLEIKGKLNLMALEKSANRIIARHDVLRTSFSFGHGLPTPEVLANTVINVPVIDLQKFDFIAQESEARRLAEKEVLVPFDLTRAPLIRLRLFLLSNDKYMLLVVIHHTLADGWSFGVFLRELVTFYEATSTNIPAQLPEMHIQYADFAHWQTDSSRGKLLQPSMIYWKKKLAGELPLLELPTDQNRGSRQTFSGGTYRFTLTRELIEDVEKFSRIEDVTMFITFLTVFYVLLHRYSGQDDILVGTPVANRNLSELENLIGVFINTLVLRTTLSGDPTLRELLNRVREVSLEAYAHQDLPFEKLVEELKPKRVLSRTPLFQVVFNLQNSPMPKLEIPGIEIKFLEINRGVSQFDMTLMLTKSEGQYHGTVEYNDCIFKQATVTRMFESYQMLLKDAITQPDRPISVLPIYTDEELHRLVQTINRTEIDFPREKCVHQLIEEQVERKPNRVAVIHDHTRLTYPELNQRANELARYLQSLGVRPGVRVGVVMKKSLEIVEVLLAVLKSGGIYVPIHTSTPKERMQFILKDANVQVLLTNVDMAPLDDDTVQVVNLIADELSIKTDCSNLKMIVSPGDLAYIIYTSGSTGFPKGVMVHHSALMNFLCSMCTRPGINEDDVLLSVTSIAFDIAALELFLPLIVGATVVIASEEMTANPLRISEAISNYDVTMMQATPTSWQLMLDVGWAGEPKMKALCGGEVLTRRLADQLLDRVSSLWNMYGPTETTVWSSISRIQKGDAPITIGEPIGNTQLYILDSHLQLVPIGVVGELHIGGEGVAQGYLNHPHLTHEKFIPDTFNCRPGARLYKTGDQARYLPDYSIEIPGRMDDQVKLNGHRIELGEIAAVLMQHPSVDQAIAISRSETSGSKRLLAYYVPSEDQSPDVGELQEFLRQKLPTYMMPSVFVRLNELPLTVNCKVNRNSLPLPEELNSLRGYTEPRNDVEQILVGIWQAVLDIEQVGIHDNFFDLGGASIQTLQVVASASLAGLHISAESIFEHQTIAELAGQIKTGQMS